MESLIGRIERLGFTPMHPNVGVTLDSWLASIKELRSTRKNEIATMVDTPSSQYGSKSHAQSGKKSAYEISVTVTRFLKLIIVISDWLNFAGRNKALRWG